MILPLLLLVPQTLTWNWAVGKVNHSLNLTSQTYFASSKTYDQTTVATIHYRNSAGQTWQTTVTLPDCSELGDASLKPVESHSASRLLYLDTMGNNWRRLNLVLCTPSHPDQVGMSARAAPQDVMVFSLSPSKKINQITLYDKWIGGTVTPRNINGELVDRKEQVSTYEIKDGRFHLVKQQLRAVPPTGGGKSEKIFFLIK